MSARSTKRRCVSTVEALSLAEARVRLLRLLGGGAPGGSGQLGTPRGRGRGHWAPSHCREWLELTASTVADLTAPDRPNLLYSTLSYSTLLYPTLPCPTLL